VEVPGMPGENCVPQGNILIIQESQKEIPDDNFAGGVLCFDFVSPSHVISVGLLDIPQRRGDFIEVDIEGASAPIRVNFAGLGNNAVQTVPDQRLRCSASVLYPAWRRCSYRPCHLCRRIEFTINVNLSIVKVSCLQHNHLRFRLAVTAHLRVLPLLHRPP
jgi:hypothetical protein